MPDSRPFATRDRRKAAEAVECVFDLCPGAFANGPEDRPSLVKDHLHQFCRGRAGSGEFGVPVDLRQAAELLRNDGIRQLWRRMVAMPGMGFPVVVENNVQLLSCSMLLCLLEHDATSVGLRSRGLQVQ